MINIRKAIRDGFWCSVVVGVFFAGYLCLDATHTSTGHVMMTFIVTSLCCNIAACYLAVAKGVVCQLIDHKYRDCQELPRYGRFKVKECARCGHIKIGGRNGESYKRKRWQG